MYELFKKELSGLEPEVRWLLQKIEGYLEMKMPARARQAMLHLPADLEESGPVRLIHLHLSTLEENWEQAAHHAARLVRDFPRSAEYWIQWAYAMRRSTGLEEAEKILQKGLQYFPKEAIFHYNLGCYASVQGRSEDALTYLDRAFALESGFKKIALDDEDLEPVWPLISNE